MFSLKKGKKIIYLIVGNQLLIFWEKVPKKKNFPFHFYQCVISCAICRQKLSNPWGWRDLAEILGASETKEDLPASARSISLNISFKFFDLQFGKNFSLM